MEKLFIDYIRRVGALDQGLYINIHHLITWTKPDGKLAKGIPGNAHLAPESAAKDIQYWLSKRVDIYLSQGGYVNAGPATDTRRYPQADRHRTSLALCRCLYADVDVKTPDGAEIIGPPPTSDVRSARSNASSTVQSTKSQSHNEKLSTADSRDGGNGRGGTARTGDRTPTIPEASSYVSVEDMDRGLAAFYASGFPPPTYIVSSGTGGMHLYWTMRECFSPSDFLGLSRRLVAALRHYGVKFDQACTTDPVRLLRVPGTLNFKRNPPLPVEVIYDSGSDYDLDDMRAALAPFGTVNGYSQSKLPSGVARDNTSGMDPTNSAFDDLGAGTELTYDTTPNNLDLLAKACPFIRDALDPDIRYSEPLWKHAISLASYCENPEDAASQVSRDDGYDEDTWQDKLAQTQQDRQNNPKLGPPRCSIIQIDGATQCATCPHITLGTTPLHVPGARPTNGHAYLAPLKTIALGTDLPWPYYRGASDNIIYHKDADGQAKTAFPYQILPGSGYMQTGEQYSIVFRTVQGNNSEVTRSFECAKLSDPRSMTSTLASQGMPVMVAQPARDFLMAYMTELRNKDKTIITVPAFGWQTLGGVRGFAYDGEFVSPTGTSRCHRHKTLTHEYSVVGDITPWSNLANLIIGTHRPDLAMLIAIGFAAPLLEMTGHPGLLIGAWSSASGIGKSTAMGLASSVWGKPITGGFNDTLNYVFQRATDLQNLPLIYDEIKGEKQTNNFCDTVFPLTGGRNRGRLDRSSNLRESMFWQTIIGYCSNSSIAAIAAERSHGTDASVYRMFETIAIQSTLKGQQHLVSTITELSNGLRNNYGCAGRAYANYLGANYASVQQELTGYIKHLEDKLRPNQPERFWFTAIAVLLVGARIAKRLGLCDFNLNELAIYLAKEFYRMRASVVTSLNDYSVPDTIFNELAQFVNEHAETRIVTDTAWTKIGRPGKNAINILNDSQRLIQADVQISGDPVTLRFRDAALADWCKKKGRLKSAMHEAISSNANGALATGRIGSGTRLSGMSESIWVVPITGTPLEDRMDFANQYNLIP